MQNYKLQTTNYKLSRGFISLYTALIASVILAMAIGILSIGYREIVLSSFAKEGDYAFYAADTGAECAVYYDGKNSFPPRDAGDSFTSFGVDCGGTVNPSGVYIPNPDTDNTYFFDIDLENNHCAKVSVFKNQGVGGNDTIIESRGYNLPCSFDISNPPPRLVERAIRVSFVE